MNNYHLIDTVEFERTKADYFRLVSLFPEAEDSEMSEGYIKLFYEDQIKTLRDVYRYLDIMSTREWSIYED